MRTWEKSEYSCLAFLGGKDGPVGFADFVYKHIVPACFLAPLKQTFDLADAQTVLVCIPKPDNIGKWMAKCPVGTPNWAVGGSPEVF